LRHLGSRRLAGLALLQMHRMLAAAVQDRIALHLVAFPRRGLELSGMSERFAPAMADGLDVVGAVRMSTPIRERTSRAVAPGAPRREQTDGHLLDQPGPLPR